MNIDSQNIGQDIATANISAQQVNIERQKVSNATGDNEKQQQIAKEKLKSAETDTRESIEVSPEQIDTAVAEISNFIQASSRQLNFSVDEDSKKQVVKVTDTESGEVIRQIPSEEILELSDRLRDLHTDVGTAVGLLFSKQA